jgi:hypothetical protein
MKKKTQSAPSKRGAQPQPPSPPDLYVLSKTSMDGPQYRRARLRMKTRGINTYLYLHWRDGDTFGEYYVGKIARKCPTPSAPAAPDQARGRRPGSAGRRGARINRSGRS